MNSGPHNCPICGDTTPEGHELCWCCEHTPKLHPMEHTQEGCEGKDSCEIDFSKER